MPAVRRRGPTRRHEEPRGPVADQETTFIVNTTPLINFAQIGRLDLLQSLYRELWVPMAVIDEITAKQAVFPRVNDVLGASFIRRCEPLKPIVFSGLQQELHAGEAGCLAVAFETPAPFLILDDAFARRVAKEHQVPFTGTIGCLLEAKRRGLIPKLSPILEAIRIHARFWINDQLRREALMLAGEEQSQICKYDSNEISPKE